VASPPNDTASPLLAPLKIGSLEVSGRLMKAATSETRCDRDGFVTDELLDFYEAMAWAGTPLIISGNLWVSRSGQSTYRMGGIDADDKIPGLTRLTEMVHGHGSKIFAQLNHCGRQVFPDAIGMESALAPSAVREKFLGTRPRAMTKAEIVQTIDDFAAAAVRAKQAGFDGAEIHMAHGYLLSEFLTPYTNRRKDEYGGSFEQRLTVPLEVLKETRRRVGDEFPLIARINGHDRLLARKGLNTQQLVEVARRLQEHGLDGVDLTVGHYESGLAMIRGRFGGFVKALTTEGGGQFMGQPRRGVARASSPFVALAANRMWSTREGFNLRYAREFKAGLSIPVICVGGFHTQQAMEAAVAAGDCDAVSLARGLIANPLMFKHVKDGTSGPDCDFCNKCIARAGGMPADCYNEPIAAARDADLASAGFAPSYVQPGDGCHT
jgi:2,4-dienoyl-CoA reductase-like NADH-dependent reductase (Old Yellow Enzyme family)